MPELVVKGLVLRAADYQESSRMLTVLTDQCGKLSVSAKGVRRKNSRLAAASQPFAFSELILTESRDRFYLREAATLELFSGLAQEVSAYALGAYVLELLDAACPEREPEPALLALGLNLLWLLSEGKKEQRLLKAAFELRLLSLLGYCPEADGCVVCGREAPEQPVLDLRGGSLYCRDCSQGRALLPVAIDEGALAALRHILRAEGKRVFAFRLGERSAARLGELAQRYVQEQLERRFSTLDYYKKLK